MNIVELNEILKLHAHKMSSTSASFSNRIFRLWGILCFNREGSKKASADGADPEIWSGLSCWQTFTFWALAGERGQNYQDCGWARSETQWRPEDGHQRLSEAKGSYMLMWPEMPYKIERKPWGRGCLNLPWDNSFLLNVLFAWVHETCRQQSLCLISGSS